MDESRGGRRGEKSREYENGAQKCLSEGFGMNASKESGYEKVFLNRFASQHTDYKMARGRFIYLKTYKTHPCKGKRAYVSIKWYDGLRYFLFYSKNWMFFLTEANDTRKNG